ncbi:hypothetical protein NHX12_026604 [Muraenolepis orangiensis]|uniref:Solute carrier family 10 member 1 n=1 Tax=Muraenolepis orangiensis TaxID=630683 RepID=A0A9Q0IQY6_9TELE|nr:hypothetical protein NHX12_026604 [Muraenolepis orangiensis]
MGTTVGGDWEWFMEDDLWSNGSSSLNTGASNSSGGAFESPMSPLLDILLNFCLAIVMFITMVSLGCNMDWTKIKEHVKKPKPMMIAVVAQFGIMPLTAFLLAKAFALNEITAVVVLVCGCCPGGTLSNILTLPLQGDMNLSIVMTSCSSALALGMMPLLLYVYCQGFPGLVSVVPYGRIIITLALLITPCGLGILMTHYRPQWTKVASRMILSVMMVALVVIACLAGFTVGRYVLVVLQPALLAIACLLPMVGFMLGYGFAAVFKLNGSCRRTISIETGCQNMQLASTILKMGFPQEVMGPLFLFPIIYIVFQLLEATVYILVSRCYRRYTAAKQKVTVTNDLLLPPGPSAKEGFRPTVEYVGTPLHEVEVVMEPAA